jgi:hypothetical protein
MDAERIVRALAAASEPAYDAGEKYCSFCGAELPYGTEDPAAHEPTCPWRLAREWVVANPTVVIATASAPLLDKNDPD